MTVLLTGSNGFIGSHLLPVIREKTAVRPVYRGGAGENCAEVFYVDDINGSTNWSGAFDNVDAVVHLAGVAHTRDCSNERIIEVNTFGTLNLARQAAQAGVKRFVFLSSVKVHGETSGQAPFVHSDAASPLDIYGESKLETEQGLFKLAEEEGIEIVIIRPPLVYGAGVKGNFASLVGLVAKGLPLPFGSIVDNRRSLVSVKNLVDLIMTCVDHPKAVNQVFLVSDDEDLSTCDLVIRISKGFGKGGALLPVPAWCYKLAGRITGKMAMVDRLIDSLQVDITHTKNTLNWNPPQSIDEGIHETIKAYLVKKRGQ